MIPQRKSPQGGGFSVSTCTDESEGAIVTTSKQLQPAMTNPLYTMSIKSRKPIAFINALFGFSIALKERCKQDYVTWGKLLFVQYGKSRRTQIMTCGFISLIDVVHRHVAKLFLIQIETRPESYGINE